ncbi:S8 family serine peptidase [Pedobacter cryoconitis]|uniref:Peptidase S8/S53 domain-containing protein n=1 Tax=Pedobacter cryoconitis TaxID=188932 RepID=A0A7X0J0C4_9SPHI|nr:S8 family serine peptidase [Pedobacter cryoconitis]MBB6498157.1 hypothetical protein [Pedobacter cryoconitis]
MKLKKIIFFAVLTSTALVSCKKDHQTTSGSPGQQPGNTPYTVAQINAEIQSQLNKNGTFSWQNTNDELLYSAVILGDSLLTIGYSSEENNAIRVESISPQQQLSRISKADAKSAGINIEGIRDNILQQIRENEHQKKSAGSTEVNGKDDVLQYESPKLTSMIVKIGNLSTLQKLRQSKQIRYLDPSNYNKNLIKLGAINNSGIVTNSSSSGPDPGSVAVDPNWFSTASDGSIIPKVYEAQHIPDAWQYSTGKGITIGVIDNGVYSTQPVFDTQFNSGVSTGRKIAKYGTFKGSTSTTDGVFIKDDDLAKGHGNSMAALIAAPRASGIPVGIAYNCNLLTYRGTDFFLLYGSKQQEGVAKALMDLADNSDVKIISMSNGWIWDVSMIADAVKYAHGKGKMIIAAGGTSIAAFNVLLTINIPDIIGVPFPGNMKEAVAATGTNYSTNSTLVKCAECHEGPEISFTTTTASAPSVNNVLLVVGNKSAIYQNTSSSSASTAINAGIAALVWGAHPSWTRDQVLQRMQQSARFYPNKDAKLGYGPIDVLKAVK